MIITKEVLITPTKDKMYYTKLGYDTSQRSIMVKVNDLQLSSNKEVQIKCDNCDSLRNIQWVKISKLTKHLCTKCSIIQQHKDCAPKQAKFWQQRRKTIEENKIKENSLVEYDNKSFQKWIKEHLTNKRGIIPSRCNKDWFKKKYLNIELNLIEKYPIGDNLTQKIYCIINEISSIPICKHQDCNNSVSFVNGEFQDFCCHTCANHITSTNKEVILKRKETCLEKYGVDNPAKKHFIELKKLNEQFKIWFNEEGKTIEKIAELTGYTYVTILGHLSREGIRVVEDRQSKIEKKICELLNIYNIKYKEQDRIVLKPKEIDIWLPDYKFGIEVDGLFWHCEEVRGKFNLLEKSNLAKKQNIQLLHIFDDEYDSRKSVIESIILSKLGIFKERIYARDCTIRELNIKEYGNFLNINHIQGMVPTKIKIGLFFKDKLLSVMGVSVPRSSNCQWELIRFCNCLNTQIIGGASKLFSFFLKNYNPDSIVSYCDLRLFQGGFYEKLGFVYSHTSKPNYYYFGSNSDYRRQSRVNFQKHKLETKLKIFDPNLSEYENMRLNKWNRIFDCGNNVYIWKKI